MFNNGPDAIHICFRTKLIMMPLCEHHSHNEFATKTRKTNRSNIGLDLLGELGTEMTSVGAEELIISHVIS